MNKSFQIMALTIVMMMMTGAAMADSVDIGLGRMDRAEFESLKRMVDGNHEGIAFVTTEKPVQVHVAEFDLSVVEEIRLAMTGNSDSHDTLASASDNRLADVGLGSMPTNEFCDLNKLVASNTNRSGGFKFLCP